MKSPKVVERIIDTLSEQHPNADTELHYRNAFELLAATILSAQSTDERVNMVTPALFKRYPDARTMGKAHPADLEKMILSTAFFRQKSKSLIGTAQQLVDEHDGAVPADMEKLTALPGVGRKTANVVLGTAFRDRQWRRGRYARHPPQPPPGTNRAKRRCQDRARFDG